MTRSTQRLEPQRACTLGARLLLPLLLVLAASLLAADGHAGAFELNDTGWEGDTELLEVVRTELGPARVHPVAVLNWDEVQAEDGVLAIHPLQGMDPDETSAFMKAGGRLAILDDYGRGDETLSRFHIERIPPPARPVSALRNRPALAIAEPVFDVIGGHSAGLHPVVAQVKQLVTNHPTGLRHPNLSPVLRIRAIGEPDVVIAVAGMVGKGRLFAMSDPSATINEMLRYPGNRAFVAGLARYLVDDDGPRRRGGRLFIVANRFSEEGSFGGEGTLRKDIESQLKALAAAFADARREGLPPWAHLALAVGVALALARWVSRASARTYRGPLPRYARPTPMVAQGGVAGRFAVLAAPSSPRGLVLLELKSALLEGLAQELDLTAEPAADALADLARRAGKLDEGAYSALKDVLRMIHDVEVAVVAGRPAQVSPAALARAGDVIEVVLAACGIARAPVANGLQPHAGRPVATHQGDTAG